MSLFIVGAICLIVGVVLGILITREHSNRRTAKREGSRWTDRIVKIDRLDDRLRDISYIDVESRQVRASGTAIYHVTVKSSTPYNLNFRFDADSETIHLTMMGTDSIEKDISGLPSELLGEWFESLGPLAQHSAKYRGGEVQAQNESNTEHPLWGGPTDEDDQVEQIERADEPTLVAMGAGASGGPVSASLPSTPGTATAIGMESSRPVPPNGPGRPGPR